MVNNMFKKINVLKLPWGEPFNKTAWHTCYREFEGTVLKRYIFVPNDKFGTGLVSSINNAYNLAITHKNMDGWLGFVISIKIGEFAGQEIDLPYIEVVPVRSENG